MRLTRSSFLFCILIILSLKLNWAKKLDKRNHKKEHSGHENVTELCVHNTDCSTDSFVCCKSHLCCSYEDYKHHLKKCGNPGTSLGCGGGNSLVCCKNDSLCRLKQDCSSEKEYVGNLKLLHFTEFQEATGQHGNSGDNWGLHEKLMAQHESEGTVLKLIISLLIMIVVGALLIAICGGIYCVNIYYQRQSQNYMKLGSYGDDHHLGSSSSSFQPYQFTGVRNDGTI